LHNSYIGIDLHPPVFLIIYCIILCIYYFFFFKKRGKKTNRLLIVAFFIFYILCVIKLAFLPIRIFSQDLGLTIDHYYQLVPFETISQVINHNVWTIQLLGNIALLFPLPIFIGLLQIGGEFKLSKVIFIGFCTSFSLEVIQLSINFLTKVPNKVADIDDLILNTLGVTIGSLIFLAIKRTKLLAKLNSGIEL